MLLWWHELISSRVSVLDLVSLRCRSILFVSWKGPQWLMLFSHLQISQLWWCCGFVVAVLLFFSPFGTWSHVLTSASLNDVIFYIFFILKCVHVSSLLFSNLIIIFSVIWSTLYSSGENFISGVDFLKMSLMGGQTHNISYVYLRQIYSYICVYAYIYVLCLFNSVWYWALCFHCMKKFQTYQL